MWRRKLDQIFEMAGPWKIDPTPHRFRHTFARLLLQRGVQVDDIATLMGHSDPKITLKHYAVIAFSVFAQGVTMTSVLRPMGETRPG